MKKRAFAAALLLVLCLLCACASDKGNKYEAYIHSLIDANYLGITEEYTVITGASAEEAEAAYQSNIRRLADNLKSYYGLPAEDSDALSSRFTGLAKTIYGKTRFEVSPVREDNGVSYVDVTIYPMDILNSTHDRVISFISELDQKVASGEFNDTVKEDYLDTLTSGIFDILNSEAESMPYKDPVTITTRIIAGKTDYYISDADFQAIDKAIIAATEN